MKRKGLDEFRIPRWEELPSIPQYLDQVLALLDEWLGEYLSQDGKPVMTRTMVNKIGRASCRERVYVRV